MMIQEEIIDMARESGMDLYGLGKDRYRFVHHLEAFAKLVADVATAKEREACAKVCEKLDSEDESYYSEFSRAPDCAEAIRARGGEA